MKIAIIGAGQQGTSLMRALSMRSDKYEIAAYDANEATRTTLETILSSDAQKSPASTASTLADAIKNADIIVLATPIDRFGTIVALPEMQEALKRGAILTDVGSAKARSELLIKQELRENATYVPAHPIVGAAGQGPATSNPDMYKDETIAIVPIQNAQAMQTVRDMWHDAGAKTLDMSAFQHDRILGTISHLEHFGVAFPLAELLKIDSLVKEENSADYRDYGNLVLDITRIANASAPMWEAISTHNKAQIVLAAEGLRAEMDKMEEALLSDDPSQLQALFRPAHDFRKDIFDVKPRVRESLQSAVQDHIDRESEKGNISAAAQATNPESLRDTFNTEAKVGLAERVTLPVFISMAVARNAMNMEPEIGAITMRGVNGLRNPSFCDGSSAALNDPAYTAKVLWTNRAELLVQIERFKEKQNEWIERVRDNDPAIGTEINRIAAVRRAVPAHRTGDALRAEHDVAAYPPAVQDSANPALNHS